LNVRMQFATPPSLQQGLLHRLWQEDSGQDMIEYALVAALVGLSTVAGVHGLANSIVTDINFVVNGFTSAIGVWTPTAP
jgi:pilus assembly protein Flp/PilA